MSQNCQLCDHELVPVVSFGRMPMGNGFLSPEEFGREYFFELELAFCPQCTMVQLGEHVDRERMFHDQYAFYSSTSRRMDEHFGQLAHRLIDDLGGRPDPFVVELGSNDGIMLRRFAECGIRHVGVEPSANVAEVARQRGVNTICAFFDAEQAARIETEHGRADVILGANVMCHIPYLDSVLNGVRALLGPEGVLVFEDPYLGDIVAKTAFDQIYDEHAFYFCGHSIARLVEKHGLELVDMEPQDVHGGSMRYTIARAGARKPHPRVASFLAREHAQGLTNGARLGAFRRACEDKRDGIVRAVTGLVRDGKRIAGYAATAKSATITNYCNLTPDLIDCIYDTTPIKHGKFSPGVHIPVVPHAEFATSYPDCALLFAWNHTHEIRAKEREFEQRGGRWLGYVPDVAFLA